MNGTNDSQRKAPIIAGNWKMNMNLAEAIDLVNEIYYGLKSPGNVEVIIAPPFILLHPLLKTTKDTYLNISAQNMFWENKGAFRTTPLAIGGLFLAAMVMFLITFNHFDNEFQSLKELLHFIAQQDVGLRSRILYEIHLEMSEDRFRA